MKTRGFLVLTAAAVLAVVLGLAARPTAAASVTPTPVDGNPHCTEEGGPAGSDQGYAYGFKPQPEPPPSGTYTLPDGVNTVTIVSDGTYFSWTSTLGMDAVIVKGGPNANVYVYDPPAESFGDSNLASPINKTQPFGISHIEFCYDYEVTVSKTATTSFTRTFQWAIDKSVSPATWGLFTGDSATSAYTVALLKDAGTDSAWAVTGAITIQHNAPFAATITEVADVISGFGGVAVNCGAAFPIVLGPGGTLVCTYATALLDGTDGTNTATVTTSGTVKGGSATAAVDFGDPTTKINDSVDVVDSVTGNLGNFNASANINYDRTFTCDAAAGQHDNIATIVQTGQSDSAGVTVTCYDLTVTKTANTTFDSQWSWTIDKSADQTALLLSAGQLQTVNYQVTVNAAAANVNHTVSGNISITNHHPSRWADLTTVVDQLPSGAFAPVDCLGVTSVGPGATLVCSYTALDNGVPGNNVATASLQNYNFDAQGASAPAGTSNFAGIAAVAYGATPANVIDECVNVYDTHAPGDDGLLGVVCAGDADKTFNYSLTFGYHPNANVPLVCGENSHLNTAGFRTHDTSATGQDTWTVTANVSCDLGCTLTPGYWKTHSSYGPAPYDDTWAQLGEGTAFFLSGQTYYQVLWTTPQGGNAYYILARAYIAAKLNGLNGATGLPAVQYDAATALFNAYTPAQVAALRGNSPVRAQFIALAGVLDAYNNGLTGPGHCSE